MNGIGWAVKEMQDGRRVRRHGWNGKGMWLAYVTADWSGAFSNSDDMPHDWAGYLPFIAMYTADKKLVPWLCSQVDLLASDWELA